MGELDGIEAAHPEPGSVETADGLRNTLRQLRIEMSITTRRVAAATGLKESDLDVLDVLARDGAQSPTVLARRTGLHPATMTGVLNRLEKAGWIVRRRDGTDRRGVRVEPSGYERLAALYREGNARLDAIAATLAPDAAAIVLDYLGRVCVGIRDAGVAEDPARRSVEGG